ncbi:MAG: GBS Bsp-like repeat-containing protein [Lachnospiraceae bacterium]|nr:GBS Bsp-like repeat-containing protein [Lachnospiraceae bacterium]
MKRKELTKRLGSLFLAGTLMFSGAVPALAEPAELPEETQVVSVLDEEAFSETMPAEEEAAETESDAEEAGESEQIQPETDSRTDEMQTEVSRPMLMQAEEAPEETEEEKTQDPYLDIIYKDGKENIVTISAQNVIKKNDSDIITVAVWSSLNGQDDLRWYQLTYSAQDDAWKADVKIADHKSTGLYYAHLYSRDAARAYTNLAKETFEIHGVEAEKLEVTEISKDKGTALVTLSGVKCPSGVTRVQFPIWCKDDQSDIVWYDGKKIAEGVYQVTLDISRHVYHYGTYKIHTYGTSGIGVRNYVAGTTCIMEKGEASLSATLSGDSYTVKALNLDTNDVKEVRFAVWSKRNAQDDLKWYVIKPTTAGTASFSWNPAETGEYFIHCYVRTNSGAMIFQKDLEVTVAGPSIESMEVAADNTNGSFKISVKGLTSPKSISNVIIPVWSDSKQKDIIWYTAAKQSDGSYTVSSNISRHGYRTGTYHAHLYVQEPNGKMTFIESRNFDIVGNVASLTAQLSEKQDTCKLSANGIVSPQPLERVQFAVWSQEGGQDDLKWYSAPLNAGSASCTVSIADHKTAGEYHVHLYGVTKTGAMLLLDKTNFTVTADVTGQANISDVDETNASFIVHAKTEGKDAVSSVSVAVWSDPDQKDLFWYNAAKDASGDWSVKAEAKNHNYNAGTYKAAVYANLESGLKVKVAETSCTLNLKNFLCVVNKGAGHRVVILRNPSTSFKQVEFPTWSSTSGQDDIVWYKGVKQADGSWQADIYPGAHPGSYYIHCYGDKTFQGSVNTSFDSSEMRTIGEQKVEKYVNQILAVTGRDLRSVYLWCVNNIYYEHLPIPMPYPAGTTRQQYYFIYAFEHRTGNCFCYAATFYYCAKALGYDARLIEGRYLRTDGQHGVHGWVEIWQNGVPYVCDPEIAWQSMHYDTYMRPYGSTALTYFRNEAAY